MEHTTKTVDTDLIAYCGLFCSNCKQYKKGKCPGCKENDKFTWCKIRSCCMEKKYKSCADCIDFENPKEYKKYNNFMVKIMGIFFKVKKWNTVTE